MLIDRLELRFEAVVGPALLAIGLNVVVQLHRPGIVQACDAVSKRAVARLITIGQAGLGILSKGLDGGRGVLLLFIVPHPKGAVPHVDGALIEK